MEILLRIEGDALLELVVIIEASTRCKMVQNTSYDPSSPTPAHNLLQKRQRMHPRTYFVKTSPSALKITQGICRRTLQSAVGDEVAVAL
jgi:hypothetical protein